MLEMKYNLPQYPCEKDVWDILAEEKRPIVVYGMGNGADKLIRRFEKYGIVISDIFASDGFVRGHSFHGLRVKSFSEIKDEYKDFVIVLSFASNKRDVIEIFRKMDKEYELYIPDMPVTDESEYFDREYYNKHYNEILRVYDMLADEKSREIYASVINYRLSGRLQCLLDGYSEKEEMYSLFDRDNICTVIDAGAYNGDTAKDAIQYFPNLERIYAIEPDKRNFKKLVRFAEQVNTDIIPINSAVWNECERGMFSDSGNRNSSVSSTASYEHDVREAELISIDSLNIKNADYIKYDVEGAEYEALIGSNTTIKASNPALLVSLYHRSRDLFFLPLYLYNEFPNYRFYIRRLYSVPAWELNLIMMPT
jgi:FkbM family methyltransferase